jgi:hypothetical protein
MFEKGSLQESNEGSSAKRSNLPHPKAVKLGGKTFYKHHFWGTTKPSFDSSPQ